MSRVFLVGLLPGLDRGTNFPVQSAYDHGKRIHWEVIRSSLRTLESNICACYVTGARREKTPRGRRSQVNLLVANFPKQDVEIDVKRRFLKRIHFIPCVTFFQFTGTV